MRPGPFGSATTGLLGPIPFFAGLLLLLVSPLMRGGNRHLALVVIETIALVVLLALCIRSSGAPADSANRARTSPALVILLASPLILAAVYLLPLPASIWASTPGRAIYLETMRDAGVTPPGWLPLSMVPDATLTSLLAGIPLVAAVLIGRNCSLGQLRLLAGCVVAVGLGQVVLGLFQISGGSLSSLYFGAGGGRPIGTFANSNHLANYLAVALTLYVWLAWPALSSPHHPASARYGLHALWVAGGLLLLLGILMTRSRGAAITGLVASTMALAWLMITSRRSSPRRSRGKIALLTVAAFAGVAALLGIDAVVSRYGASDLLSSASFRGILTISTLQGAAEFWPWGAGWGTFGAVYPRYQPAAIPGAAGHAHQDYAEMLFDGGIFAVALVATFAWLLIRRTMMLLRLFRARSISSELRTCVVCGLALLGFLLHSLVEFNMHIPANAIVASLLAGVYLRPLADAGRSP
jgi:hypothetical protein